MKKYTIVLFYFLFFAISLSYAQTNPRHVKVGGYTKSNGTYVKPHYRTAPNSTNRDNFSTRGNTNPYTGKSGWIPPDNKNLNVTMYEYTHDNEEKTNKHDINKKVRTIGTTIKNSNSQSINNNNNNNNKGVKKNSGVTNYVTYASLKNNGQLWRDPKQLYSLQAVSKGLEVRVISYSNGFYKVIANGKIGFINEIIIHENQKLRQLSKQVYTTVISNGQLWKEPQQLKSIRPISKGTYVKVIDYENDFWKVSSDGTIGYIYNPTLKVTYEMLKKFKYN